MPRSTSPRTLMTPAELHILLSFADGPRHGYAVQREVEARTEGRLVLGPGTLYEAIHRMLARGWLLEAPEVAEGRRKAYRLSDDGAAEMRRELGRLDQVVAWARSKDLLDARIKLSTEAPS